MFSMRRAERNNRQYEDYLHEKRFEEALDDYNELQFAILKENAKSAMTPDYSSSTWVTNCKQYTQDLALYGYYELWALHLDSDDSYYGDYESLLELISAYSDAKKNHYWVHGYAIRCITYTYHHITSSVVVDTMTLEL